MHMVYDSDAFAVVHLLAHDPHAVQSANHEDHHMPRHGFEIVDKRSGKEIYLDGSWAEVFQQQIEAWQVNHPTQEEVEAMLEGYASLAHTPVVVH